MAVFPVHSENPAASVGKQRAASSGLEWEIREAGHPILGNIRFAFLKKPVETQVGKEKVFSGAYVSCQKGSSKLAIELANTTAPDDPGGLRPSRMPRLVCRRPAAPGDDKLVLEELPATWEVNAIGDALAQGFEAAAMRECVSIGIVQEVAVPPAWGQKSAQVIFELTPYNRELDSIFATCGEVSAYALAAPAKAAATAGSAAASAPTTRSTPAQDSGAPWRTAHVGSSGKTNVRARPKLQSPIVAQLDPGAVILVQRTAGDWWRAKPRAGAAFDGYIRQDRLVFK
jgi:hypothetical protein